MRTTCRTTCPLARRSASDLASLWYYARRPVRILRPWKLEVTGSCWSLELLAGCGLAQQQQKQKRGGKREAGSSLRYISVVFEWCWVETRDEAKLKLKEALGVKGK
jgi:hypothetical protein